MEGRMTGHPHIDAAIAAGRVTVDVGPPVAMPTPRNGGGKPRPLTEKEFQAAVVSLAKAKGWLTYHTFDSRRSEKGFLDLVLVRESVLWVECKTDKGRLTPDQRVWAEALEAAGQRVCIWRPKDWRAICEVLA